MLTEVRRTGKLHGRYRASERLCRARSVKGVGFAPHGGLTSTPVFESALPIARRALSILSLSQPRSQINIVGQLTLVVPLF